MSFIKKVVPLFSILLASFALPAQKIGSDMLAKQWAASWISVPNAPANAYGVYLFRKTIDLKAQPASFVVHVSADNRYKLFVNEKLVSLGPARGDLSHWNFETVDIAPWLHPGKNIVAAQVWNEGAWRPEAQITFMTGFILQGGSPNEAAVNTNKSWKCQQDSSFAPIKINLQTYYVAGAGEDRNMALSPKNWQKADFNDAQWPNAQSLFNGLPKTVLGEWGTTNGWMLVPSTIPQMELKEERFAKIVQADGPLQIPVNFLQQPTQCTIPPHSSIKILLDQSHLTNAYFSLLFSGGANADIHVEYAESLFDTHKGKGNRNDTQGKTFLGRRDKTRSDGTENQSFTTLTYRTYRYVQLQISTQNEALILHDVYGTFTGYPFERKARLTTNDAEIDQILNIGWRTARLCAMETYMDCPYYEQLQYIGDGRIQALVSLYNSGDDRLVKNALNLMDFSRQPEGVTLSRHPSYTPQYIPTFSLWYIGMLQDYSRYGSDVDFVKEKMGGVRQILGYFKNYQQADGSLKNVPQWMFTDWVEAKDWRAGVAPMGANGNSAVLDLQLLWAYQVAADLETQLGMPAYALLYQKEITRLKKTIQAKYWDNTRKLFADRPEKDLFSQHANTLAILTGLLPPTQASAVAEQLVRDSSLAPASIYFKYYLHLALIKAGRGNDYLQWLDKWRENIEMGLTTWAEISDIDKARSDCHAWGSSPNIEFYRTFLGIDSDGLGFSKVKIEPHLGTFTQASGQIPHPKGTIAVSYSLENNRWKVAVELPPTVSGTLVWKGRKMALKAGKNQINL